MADTSWTLAQFLSFVLTRHADGLKLLAETFSEKLLIEILERRFEDESYKGESQLIAKGVWEDPEISHAEEVYEEIQNSVEKSKLSKPLEFYLWTYPYYRRWIEDQFLLDSVLKKNEYLEPLLEEAQTEWVRWLDYLGIPDLQANQIKDVMNTRWQTEQKKVQRVSHLKLI